MTHHEMPQDEGGSGPPGPATDGTDRRDFLSTTSTIVMGGGLVAGYGTFFAMAGRFVYPARGQATAWQFLAVADEVAPGGSFTYKSPVGATIVVARQDRPAAAATDGDAVLTDADIAAEFIALSSVCPHLGCKVHWEANNDRFFCPCHNGAFDRQGAPTEGPPAAANQSLTRFPLQVEKGLLYIEVPMESVVDPEGRSVASAGRHADDGNGGLV